MYLIFRFIIISLHTHSSIFRDVFYILFYYFSIYCYSLQALERNMSLSSQYLEELSRRYKKQMEEMQRLFDKTLSTLTTESRQKDQHNKRLETELEELRRVVDDLVVERSNWTKFSYFILLLVVVVFCFIGFFRRTNSQHSVVEIQRRNSVGVITHQQPQKKQRRPSEEAMKIKGSYKELMVDDIDGHIFKSGRKRKKRKESPRSNSFTTLPEEKELVDNATKSIDKRESESAPSDKDWVESNKINDVPIVLEESDNTFLELPLVNGGVNHSPPFMKTATKVRLSRSASHTPTGDSNGNHVEGKHKKSVSVDETSKIEPFNGNVAIVEGTPTKKEKKSLFKIFKKK